MKQMYIFPNECSVKLNSLDEARIGIWVTYLEFQKKASKLFPIILSNPGNVTMGDETDT